MDREKASEESSNKVATIMKVNGYKIKKRGLADISKIIILNFMKDIGKKIQKKVSLE